MLNDDELEKRTLRRIQKAARQQQKQQEQKRLRIAQELQRHMEEVEVGKKLGNKAQKANVLMMTKRLYADVIT